MKLCFFTLLQITILCFHNSQAYGLGVQDYYSEAPPEFFKYFYSNLFKDKEFSFLDSSQKNKENFNKILLVWMDQIKFWSFKLNTHSIFYLNIFYNINNNNRKINHIDLYFENVSNLIKLKDLLKNSNSEIKFSSNLNEQNLIGIRFNQKLQAIALIYQGMLNDPQCLQNKLKNPHQVLTVYSKVICDYIVYEKPNDKSFTITSTYQSITIKEFKFFPDYLFFKKSDFFNFFFKKWRIPINYIIFDNKKPIGFILH